ncbi:argonaute siRNA chaperone complex subunit Arb1 [Stagonosporopsis vannaccii]|nr:argonaute siRNA chaperone complex subunit Arb1 [Stagonosporopsis vannaccii]
MSTEKSTDFKFTPEVLAQAGAQVDAARDDHPEGAAIRRQVEFYFSDENLPTDLHLLQQCGGRENIPVSISRICGLKKMRAYKPKSLVVTALRKSAFLDVSPDGKTVRRKVPLQGRTLLDENFCKEDDEISYDVRSRKPALYPVTLHPQQKKVYPKGTSKNMQKPTGFEDAYIEPPIKPEEAEEEDRMYDEDKPFVERIEIAIQRFKQKRRMHEIYAKVFNKFMRYGGVESGPRMHQGISKTEMRDMDAEEIARALAVHQIPWNRSDKEQWIVDFYGVGAAFLSSWYPTHYGYAPGGIKSACQVLRSFYNYLRYHGVCPEYDEQLQRALKLCDTAECELTKVHAAGLALPGAFNTSASTLFGGSYAGLFTGDKAWAQDAQDNGVNINEMGLREEEARIKFSTGIAALGTDEQQDLIGVTNLEMLRRESTGLEVTAIAMPEETTREIYAAQTEIVRNKLGQLEPLGKLKCKAWYADDCDEWDLPKGKYLDGKPHKVEQGKEFEFWVEECVLSECFLGMKMDATVITLEGGFTILDETKQTYCSFYTWVPNELWMENKPKELRWLAKGLAEHEEVEVNGVKSTCQGMVQEDDEFDDE